MSALLLGCTGWVFNMMDPFKDYEFYNPDGLKVLTVSQPDKARTRLRFAVEGGHVELSWFQVRDMFCEFDEWLVNNAHLARS